MSVEFRWNGPAAVAGMQAAKQTGLRQAAEAVLAESNNRVPFRDGHLKGSGSTAVSGSEAAIGYSAVYAARQHEEIGWNHPNGGQAKYLETALTASAGDVQSILAQAIKRGIGA